MIEKKEIFVTIEVKSPLHLSSGNADVNVDMDIVHDKLGFPYFPARRFKGLLYESAIEVSEMMSQSELNIISKHDVEELFKNSDMTIENFHLPDYNTLVNEWDFLIKDSKGNITPADILDAYTGLRSQTALEENGTAKTNSLRTIRVLDLNDVKFEGNIRIENKEIYINILALALQNLTQAGANRHRGFGKIECKMQNQEYIIKNILGGIM